MRFYVENAKTTTASKIIRDKILPTTWAMQGMLGVIQGGKGVMAILPEAGVLLGFEVLFFSVGVWRFRYE